MGEALDRWDIKRTNSEAVQTFFKAAPGGVPTQVAFSQNRRWEELDLDREGGVIREAKHASRRTAAWPCCSATWPRTAAS